ncbi:MAG TPA: glucose 1-dehydrogenase [Herbaspirillum sp.]|jgi:3-oxoacyl-[acyl-carrier protein] reductase
MNFKLNTAPANRLKDRVAIITGGAHGIGKAYAQRFVAEGAKVVVADIDGAAAEQVAKEIGDAGGTAIGMQVDIADLAMCQQMAQAAMEKFGRIDALVNNAALFSRIPMTRGRFDEIPEAEWDRMFQVNVKGIWYTCRSVVPFMEKQQHGRIVNVSSSTVFQNPGTRIHYIASKAAVIGFTRTLAREIGPSNITVNCISPGSTLSEEDPSEEMKAYRARRVADRSIQRVQYPDDLAGAAVFFCSDESSFITGQNLIVDGGQVMI